MGLRSSSLAYDHITTASGHSSASSQWITDSCCRSTVDYHARTAAHDSGRMYGALLSAGAQVWSGNISYPCRAAAIDDHVTRCRRDGITTAMWNSGVTSSCCCGHVQSPSIAQIDSTSSRFRRAPRACVAAVGFRERIQSRDQTLLVCPHSVQTPGSADPCV